MLVACGLNHKSAPIDLRERVHFAAERLPQPLRHLVASEKIQEAAILSTCNRTELYCYSAEPDAIRYWLAAQHQVQLTELDPHLYFHQQTAAVQHLLRVASGLDSMVLGEPQILGQVKHAYSLAKQAGTIGAHLGRLFPYAFSVSKRVRTITEIGAHPLSLAFALVSQAKNIFSNLAASQVVMIGAGETIELVAQYFTGLQCQSVSFVNRSFDKAKQLATQFGGTAASLADLKGVLQHADIVVSATASCDYVLHRHQLEAALSQQKRRPLFLVDLAVPRDIDISIAEMRDVYLYNIDDLQTIIDQGAEKRSYAALEAEELIATYVDDYVREVRALSATTAIKQYREHATSMRDSEVEKAIAKLAKGKTADEVVQELAHSLTNKLLHQPTSAMRKAGIEGRQDDLLQLCKIFKPESDD